MGFLKRLKRARLNPEERRLWKTLQFLMRLLLLSIPLYAVMLFVDLEPLQAIAAVNSYWLLKLMGFHVVLEGANMAVGQAAPFFFYINEDCTGWKSMIFLFALIFAVPGISLRKRLLGLLIGIPLIWLGNLGRILGVVLVERSYGVELAMLVHDYLWRLGLVALVLAIWIVWLLHAREREPLWKRLLLKIRPK